MTTLYRPFNWAELNLIAESGWRKFPPRLPEQPFFYPVLNIEYARQITIEWNVPAYGVGYVTKFEVDTVYISVFEIHNVGGHKHDELWIPSEELANFNDHILGVIQLVETYH